MRYLVFSLLAIAVVSAASKAEESVQLCEPGKAFKRYCNLCSCSDNGRGASCTKMYCPPGVYNEDGTKIDAKDAAADDTRVKREIKRPVICEPGKSFRKYCNTCICSEDGTDSVCTKMACLPGKYEENGSINFEVSLPNLLRKKHQTDEKVRVCEPGKIVKLYCNTCKCSAEGTYGACTLMACPPGMYNEDGSRTDGTIVDTLGLGNKNDDPVVCEPGKTFKKYCNSCLCFPDGKTYGCTYSACPPGFYNEDGSLRAFFREKRQTEDKRVCEPGKIFKQSCNTCKCAKDGTIAVCTLMICEN